MIVNKRNDLFSVLKRRGLVNTAIEIGVAEGAYSFYLLDCLKTITCFQVDPWEEMEQEQYTDINNQEQSEQDRRYELVCQKAKEYKGRAIPLRSRSVEASKLFPDGFFQFIYIDANHKLEYIRHDLKFWWPKCASGGIFAGHDYLDGSLNSGDYGVKTAVDEFVETKGLSLRVTKEPDYPSWWLVKP